MVQVYGLASGLPSAVAVRVTLSPTTTADGSIEMVIVGVRLMTISVSKSGSVGVRSSLSTTT